ncbi:XRN 5'-3' exonuclease N-terminus [seawater metagenome]|uniref:XRN 5'-3' exonuclease N-terminus n=1 Tax=seawater metagenome TaxID=1561972 RepID=A0A5E8CKZ5_9ZZZZ
MGIERFFASIYKNYDIVFDMNYPYKRIPATHIYFDFNSIVHIISKKVINKGNTQNLNKRIIDSVLEYILNFLSKNLLPLQVKYILLALDGVPSMAKMIEQQHRRYMGELISIMLDSIGDKDNISWSKNNISPGTQFMHSLSQELKSPEFKLRIKKICSQSTKIVVSDIYEFNEGEKKIVDKIQKTNFNNDDKILIFSPDADMILLALLLPMELNINIYRHNQQKSDIYDFYNLININLLSKTIYEKIKQNLKTFKRDINIKNILQDLVFIFTIFGDDFLPKIDTFDVRKDIDIILEIYSLTLGVMSQNYLLKFNGQKYEIVSNFLKRLLYFMKTIEKKVKIINKKMAKYHNYSSFVQKSFIRNVHQFEIDVKKIKKHELIKKILTPDSNDDKYSFFIENLMFRIDKISLYSFLKELKLPAILKYKQFFIYFIPLEELIDYLIDYTLKFKKFPIQITTKFNNKSNEKLLKYSKNSSSKYHQNKMKNLNKIEKKKYILLNTLDHYHEKFNKDSFIEKSAKAVDNYFEGIQWILNYYYNDETKELTWIYKYDYSPSIADLYKFINEKDVDFRFKKIDNMKNYFTVLEQLIFITPFSAQHIRKNSKDLEKYFYLFKGLLNKDQMKKISRFITSHTMENHFFDLNILSNKILNDKSNKEINCHDIIFLNKCNLNKLSYLKFESLDFVKEFRKYFSLEDQLNIYPMIY